MELYKPVPLWVTEHECVIKRLPPFLFSPSLTNSNKVSILWFSPPASLWYKPKHSETVLFPALPLSPLNPPPSTPSSKALMESMWWRDEIAASSLSLKKHAPVSLSALFLSVLFLKKHNSTSLTSDDMRMVDLHQSFLMYLLLTF